MTTTTASKITYRKTKTGEWVACGPAADLRVGAVTVSKKDGTSKVESITRLGRPFTAGGVEMVYGYLAPKAVASSRRSYQDYLDYCPNDGDCWSMGAKGCRSCGS